MIYNIYITWQLGLSHLTSHTDVLGSKQDVWHFGGSHTGSQIAGQWGSSHFQEHWGWHWDDVVIKVLDTAENKIILSNTTIFI
jgi:hypothetical protein